MMSTACSCLGDLCTLCCRVRGRVFYARRVFTWFSRCVCVCVHLCVCVSLSVCLCLCLCMGAIPHPHSLSALSMFISFIALVTTGMTLPRDRAIALG